LRDYLFASTMVMWKRSAGREREQVVAMLFAIADLNAKVGRILHLLEEEFGGGEALPEGDT
jgi:hypothetical protein